MAENKKAFIIYTNWKNYTDIMTNEQAGIWIKWCLDYCNDLQPEMPTDATSKMLCIMCKDILKADLKKYEEKRERFKKIGKQYVNDTENNTEIGDRKREPKTDSVISNKLIVNSNKCISNDILNNACACESLKNLIAEIEKLIGRSITNAEYITIEDFTNTMSEDSILRDIKAYSDKTNPIAYMKKAIEKAHIESQVTPLEDKGGSEWLDNFRKQFK